MSKPFVIGIAGGSGSGKSTLAARLQEEYDAAVFTMDHYFIDPADMLSFAGYANYDNPASIDIGRTTQDFDHLLSTTTHKVVIIEGILALYFPEIRKLLDLKLFLKAPHKVTIQRRVHPAEDRYRSEVIKPMYEKYIEPTAQYADCTLDAATLSQDQVFTQAVEVLKAAQES